VNKQKQVFNQLSFVDRIGDWLHLSRPFEVLVDLDEAQLEKSIQEINSASVDFANYRSTIDHTVHPHIFTIDRIRKSAKGKLEAHLIGRIVASSDMSKMRLTGKVYPNTVTILMFLLFWIMVFLVFDKHILAAVFPGAVVIWYIKDSLQIRDETLKFFKESVNEEEKNVCGMALNNNQPTH
jgi:hypothetical protein